MRPNAMSKNVASCLVLAAAMVGGAGRASAQDSPSEPFAEPAEHPVDYAGGTLRGGAFFVSDLHTSIYTGTTRHPFGTRVRLDRDLGVEDSLVAGRIGWEQRFNRRHGMDVDYYELSVDGQRALETGVTIGNREFAVGVDVASSYRERIFKLSYNFFFHDEGKVALDASAGIHVSEFDLRIGAAGAVEQEEATDAEAPLPVLGGRLLYRITPKLSMIAGTDLFLLKTDEQQGSLTDGHLLFEHRTLERVYFGAGLTRFELNLDIVDEATRDTWEWRSIYNGVYVYAVVRFPP